MPRQEDHPPAGPGLDGTPVIKYTEVKAPRPFHSYSLGEAGLTAQLQAAAALTVICVGRAASAYHRRASLTRSIAQRATTYARHL